MTTIHLETVIHAPQQICFDLSRSIDFHMESTRHTNEKAIAGRTAGLISLNEFVTWRAIHFMLTLEMSVKIIVMEASNFFIDEMIRGPFKSMKHLHSFSEKSTITVMRDTFEYEVPYGIAGKIFDNLILKGYMTHLLAHRNKLIKKAAETNGWKKFIME
jgi:ligand-binding SRPBCC domain-containing protein